MNLKITGLNFDVTAAIKNHVTKKLERISRHASSVISTVITLSVERVNHRAEVDIHLAGKGLYAEAVETGMCAAVDVLMDKIDYAILRYRKKSNDVHNTARPATE